MISSPFFKLSITVTRVISIFPTGEKKKRTSWASKVVPGLRAPLTPIGEGTISTFQVGTWSCQSPTRWSSLLKHTVSLRGKKTAFQVKRHFFGEKNNGNIELSLTGRRRMSDFFSTVGTSSIVRSDFNLWTSHSSDPSHNVSTSGWRTFGSSTVGHRYELDLWERKGNSLIFGVVTSSWFYVCRCFTWRSMCWESASWSHISLRDVLSTGVVQTYCWWKRSRKAPGMYNNPQNI